MMKKIHAAIFFMLIAVVILSAANCSAASKETYTAVHNAYDNEYGTVEFLSTDLIFTDQEGKKTTVFDIQDYDEYGNNVYNMSFFMADDSLIYSFTPLYSYAYKDGSKPQKIIKRNLLTGETQVMEENVGDIIGGYGDRIITRRWDTGDIYQIAEGETNKLFSVNPGEMDNNSSITIFAGKLYYNNKVYDLESGEETKFVARSMVSRNKYCYFVNGSQKLIRMNQNDRKVCLAKKAKDVIGGDDSGNAVFRKQNHKGELAIYYVKGNKKRQLITKQKKLEDRAFHGKYKGEKTIIQTKAVVGSSKICIALQAGHSDGVILSIPKKGGKIKELASYEEFPYLEILDGRLYITCRGHDDIDHNSGDCVVIK